MTQVSNEVLREWVGVLDQVAARVVPARPIPEGLAKDLQQVIDEMAAISERREPAAARRQVSGVQESEEGSVPEQVGETLRRRLRDIQKRSIQ